MRGLYVGLGSVTGASAPGAARLVFFLTLAVQQISRLALKQKNWKNGNQINKYSYLVEEYNFIYLSKLNEIVNL